MKIRILLTTLGVAALTVMTINANGALLSPRAASNQLGTASGTATEPNLVAVTQGSAASPRALGNQPATVAGVVNDVNPAIACRGMTAGAKAIQACAANPTAAMPCCGKSAAAAN